MQLLQMSFYAAVLITIIVLIRTCAMHALPKKALLVLWGVALCHLLLPFSVSSQLSFYNLFSTLDKAISPSAISSTVFGNGILSNASIIAPTLLTIWAVGAAISIFFILVNHLACLREYKTALPIGDNGSVAACIAHNPLWRRVRVRISDKIALPLTYGLWCPVILLPKTMDMSNEIQLSYVLMHELSHIKHLDVLYKLALALALCVHWFNPMVWVMCTLAKRDIELACDETVIQTFGASTKSAYARTLIDLEAARDKSSPLCNNFSKSCAQERIISIMKTKKLSTFSMSLALILVTCTTAMFATSHTTQKVTKEFIISR